MYKQYGKIRGVTFLNINKHLLEHIKPDLKYYDCNYTDIERFLDCEDHEKRQDIAIDIIKKVMKSHKKKKFIDYITELSRVEFGTRNLSKNLRDHVNHALLTFILGIYINENLLKKLDCSVDPFDWKLASLFHDIGYPLEVALNKIIKNFELTINDIKNSVSDDDNKEDIFTFSSVKIINLTDNRNGIELIQKRIEDWELEIDAKDEYDKMNPLNICHGIISALVVLQIVDLMYKKHNPQRKDKKINNFGVINWNQKCFDDNVVSACTAIYLHNLPSSSFKKTKINLLNSPLAFLLKLSDSLQDWERPSSKYLNGYSASDFDIEIHEGKIYYTAPSNKKIKIKEEIESSLANYQQYIEFIG